MRPETTGRRIRMVGLWLGLLTVLAVPVALSAASPLLQWRQPVYIAAGLAGVAALALLLLQPLAIGGFLPGLSAAAARRLHRWLGAGLTVAVLLHLAGLWITSPPDVVDALLFRSPTPFSAWGVIALAALCPTACLAGLRRRLSLPQPLWRRCHLALALLIVTGTIIHALLIEGTMETVSKSLLCLAVVLATLAAVRATAAKRRRRGPQA